ncbi:MAG: tRNA 2-thiouridine(34) synthase MnmA [Alphaproteobacteria bacterium]|nr:MAG: tRNA 2-thiouridine(34) synthase MnmA [Alphaproteobacteria bacterium]
MSGGVDSSVVAALLAHEGHEVIGITLQLYDHGAAVQRRGACCAGQDIYDARRVAERLGIPHYVLDYESVFRSEVIDDFADSYLAGATPLPCVRCNQRVKFRDLLQTARELGADFLATGHYVRRVDGPHGAQLLRAADPARDQSYFLFATTREQLAMLQFPLGGLASKAQTRALARRFGLEIAEKPDSQDICFVPQGRYGDVIARLRPGAAEPGEIVHLDGRVLGRHRGIIHYTVGQRRGLGIGGGEPLYVIRLDPARRQVVVGPRAALATRTIRLAEVNWLGDRPFADAPAGGWPVEARVRSTSLPVPARVEPGPDGTATVTLAADEAGVAPGQACVFYAGARVLGGGWIRR